MITKGNRTNLVFAGFWLVAAILNAWFAYSMHFLVDWFLAAGCIAVAAMYALRVVRS
jgi:hypothetical protein